MRAKFTSYVSIVILVTGCANLTSPARGLKLEEKGAYWFDYDASRRGTLLLPENEKFKTCAEPSPDAALNLVTKLEATLKKDDAGEVVGNADFNSSIVKLAERTQMILFLRESLFRLCEQSLNNNFTAENILTAYKEVIAAAMEMAKTAGKEADTQKTKAEMLRTLTEKGASPEEIKKLLK